VEKLEDLAERDDWTDPGDPSLTPADGADRVAAAAATHGIIFGDDVRA
jgi:hypothetical protein